MKCFSSFIFTILLVTGFANASVPVTSDMKSFSSAIKGGTIEANVETTVLERSDGPGVITEQWYTGIFDEKTIVKIYVDGETTPSIDFALLLGHGVGFNMSDDNNNAPWGTKTISHNAANGGLFNTYRIPYSTSITITITNWQKGVYWYIVRGVTNYPVIIGDLQLPSKPRLRLYKNENVELVPYQFLTLANVSNTAGLIYQVTLMANSSDLNYLEACFRLKVDDDTNYQFLSSGTEDFFLSAYYFNRGLYHDNHAGCTYLHPAGKMSAYKFFESDPLLFTTSMELVWRCGETQGDSAGCPNTYPSQSNKNPHHDINNLKLANTVVTTYVWVYEYDFD